MVLALLSNLCFTFASAQAYQPSPAAIKSVDAQALAFTGQHCGPDVKGRAPSQMSADDFKTAVGVMELLTKAQVKKEPSIKLKSRMVSKNLFLMALNSAKSGVDRSVFFVMFYDQGVTYLYSCDQK